VGGRGVSEPKIGYTICDVASHIVINSLLMFAGLVGGLAVLGIVI
jgi:hypothetical protein